MTTIDDIKARIDIVDLVSETVQLRRSGKSYTGFCPFHPNSRTPAFVVFPETGTWRCFGQCNEGGDIFRYVMKKEGWDFSEALHFLAGKAGVELKPPTPAEQASAEEHDHLRLLLEEAASFYQHQLLQTAAGKHALEYLKEKRKLTDDTIEAFGLGYAPGGWDAALKHLTAKGHDLQVLLDAGLISERQREADGQPEGQRPAQRIYDRFRHRLMIPIRDERGRMAGFGARILNPDDVPKFLNSPQTAVFDKGRLLYGLDKARKAIRSLDQAIIVEGYLDVIALHQAGFANAVSPMGTALTEHQLVLLKRFSRRIVLALDSDAAGNQATLRGLEVARQAMDHEYQPDFFAPGKLMALEARLQADLRITTLPEGVDPDEIVNRDPNAWSEIVAQARPIVIHVMETLAAGRDLSDPKIKTEIANQVLPLIRDVASPIERDTYRQRLARLLQVDERTLDLTAPARPRPSTRRSTQQPQASKPVLEPLTNAPDSTYSLEAHCLGVLLRHPDLLYKIDRIFQEYGLGRLSLEDFQHASHQDILRLLQESIDQDLAEPLNFVMNSLSLEMMDMADTLLARTDRLDPGEDRVLDDLVRTLVELRKQRLSQSIVYMSYLYQEAQESGDLRALQYGQTMMQHIRVKNQLDQAYGKYTRHATAGN